MICKFFEDNANKEYFSLSLGFSSTATCLPFPTCCQTSRKLLEPFCSAIRVCSKRSHDLFTLREKGHYFQPFTVMGSHERNKKCNLFCQRGLYVRVQVNSVANIQAFCEVKFLWIFTKEIIGYETAVID